MSDAKKERRAERARVGYARMMQANGTPGWSQQRRNRALTVAGLVLAAGALLAAVAGALDGSWGRFGGFGVVGLILLALSWPLQRGTRPIEKVVRDGRPALAIPMRPVPLRIAVGLSVVGVAVLVGGVASGLEELDGGSTVAAVWAFAFGGLTGLLLLGLGMVNLVGPARRPHPVLVDGQGVTWWLAREPQLVRWDYLIAVEEWSRPIGLGIFQPRANLLMLRTREGAHPGWIDHRLLAADPVEVRDLLRHYLAEPAERATLSRTG